MNSLYYFTWLIPICKTNQFFGDTQKFGVAWELVKMVGSYVAVISFTHLTWIWLIPVRFHFVFVGLLMIPIWYLIIYNYTCVFHRTQKFFLLVAGNLGEKMISCNCMEWFPYAVWEWSKEYMMQEKLNVDYSVRLGILIADVITPNAFLVVPIYDFSFSLS